MEVDTAAASAVIPVEDRTQDGRFPKGVSGNPAGRPAGSKNLQRQLEDSVREYIAHPARIQRVKRVIDRILQKAEDGHMGAAKLLLDKIVPNARDEDDSGGSNSNTYVFRIENATFAAPKDTKPIATDVEVIDVTPQETK